MKSTSHKIFKYKAFADQLTKVRKKNKRSRSSINIIYDIYDSYPTKEP
jgi:hypothetical protein